MSDGSQAARLRQQERASLISTQMLTVEKWLRYCGLEPDARSVREIAEKWVDEEAHRQLRALATAERQAFQRGQVCAFVADGRSRAAAARAAGVTPETVNRWVRIDPVFRTALQAAASQSPPQPQQQRRRPLKMTSALQARIVELLTAGNTRTEAAAGAGVSRQTLYTWLKRLPEFEAAVIGAEELASVATG